MNTKGKIRKFFKTLGGFSKNSLQNQLVIKGLKLINEGYESKNYYPYERVKKLYSKPARKSADSNS